MLLFLSGALAETRAADELASMDLGKLYDFAREQGAAELAEDTARRIAAGETPDYAALGSWLAERLREPFSGVLKAFAAVSAPMLLLTFFTCLSGGRDGSGAQLLLRLMLLGGFAGAASLSISAASTCIQLVKRLTDIISPLLVALMTGCGMSASAAIVSPLAALSGAAAVKLLGGGGLALCRGALCMAIAGNLSASLSLDGFSRLARRSINWISGLATTLFTCFLSLQSGLTANLDAMSVRTVKYAVDSAAPIIGNGISDAWEGYISGVMIAKDALGMSGIFCILAAGARPMLTCAASMLMFSLASAFMDALGEKLGAHAARQMSGVCQMALTLATAAIAISMVLLGGAMGMGKNLGR